MIPKLDRKFTSAFGVAVAAMIIVSISGQSMAFAADGKTPTHEEIMRDCQSGKGRCTFDSPVIRKVYLGNFRKVSDVLFNCGEDSVSESISWQDTVESTSSLGVTLEAGGGVSGILNLSLAANYGHAWTDSHTETSTLSITVQPGHAGWIERAQVMREMSGVWKTDYRWKKGGHRHWLVPDIISGPAKRGTNGVNNAVVFKSRPMTGAETKSCSFGIGTDAKKLSRKS